MHSILSEITYIDKNKNKTEEIEAILLSKYGSIIRWAIVGVEGETIKISVTYETGAC